MDERVALAKETAMAMVPVIRVESHGLATPGKRLLWHLSHLRFKTGNCFFSGTPVSLERKGDRDSHTDPPLLPHPSNPSTLPLGGAVAASGVGTLGAGIGAGVASAVQEGASGAQEGAGGAGLEHEVGKIVRWSFAASSVVLALDVKGSCASLHAGGGGKGAGFLLLDSVFQTALRFVHALAQQSDRRRPQGHSDSNHAHHTSHTPPADHHIFISIVAQGSRAGDLRMLCHHALLSTDTWELVTKSLSAQFDVLRAQMISGSWCRREEEQQDERSDLQHLLSNSLRLLALLPASAAPSITLVCVCMCMWTAL
jgi:hypothetical protein